MTDNNFEEFHGCKTKIKKDYIIYKNHELGKGQFGKVVKGKNKKTNVKVAIKMINKKEMTLLRNNIDINDGATKQKFIRETNIMKICNHPHIVRYYGCYEDDRRFYIVMERIDHGDLFDYLSKRERVSESITRQICVQLISALEYCHGNLITHRDLKLENILISDKKNMIVKLSDFGLSTYINMNSFQKTFCGSIHYAAPEIVNGNKYNPIKSDIWSIGVIMYSLLLGRYPWKATCINDTINDIVNFNYVIPEFNMLSDGVKDLISHIFVPANRRISISDIKNHIWLKNYVLPSYLELRIQIKAIDCLIIDKIISLGFDKQDTLLSVYENKNTIENAMYHILFNKYKKVTSGGSHITKFIRMLSSSSSDSDNNVSGGSELNLPLNNIKEQMTPRSSSDPVRKSRILSKLTPRSYREKVKKGEINKFSSQMLTSLQKSTDYYNSVNCESKQSSPRKMTVDDVIPSPRKITINESSSESSSSESSLTQSMILVVNPDKKGSMIKSRSILYDTDLSSCVSNMVVEDSE